MVCGIDKPCVGADDSVRPPVRYLPRVGEDRVVRPYGKHRRLFAINRPFINPAAGSRRAGVVAPYPGDDFRRVWMIGTRHRQPFVGAGLTPRALAPPTAHSSQGVAGAAPPFSRQSPGHWAGQRPAPTDKTGIPFAAYSSTCRSSASSTWRSSFLFIMS